MKDLNFILNLKFLKKIEKKVDKTICLWYNVISPRGVFFMLISIRVPVDGQHS